MSEKIVKFETPQMAVDRTQRSLRHCFSEVAARTKKMLDTEDLSDRTRLEARLVHAIAVDDEVELERVLALIKKLDATGMKLVK